MGLGQLCLCAVGWWQEDATVTQHGEHAWGVGRAAGITALLGVSRAPPLNLVLLPNENQLYICFISAQHCSSPRERRTWRASSAMV